MVSGDTVVPINLYDMLQNSDQQFLLVSFCNTKYVKFFYWYLKLT